MKIGFLGDIILSDKTVIDSDLLTALQATNFNIANLEAPFIESGMKARKNKGLHQLTNSCALLHQLNIKAVSLANNHMMDFGEPGLHHTIKTLEENNIGYFGAGLSMQDSRRPFEITHDGEVFQFCGAMQNYFARPHFARPHKAGVASWPHTSFELHQQNQHSFLFLHWNQEFEDYPEPASKYYAEAASPDFQLIIGSHSHCIQGIQTHHNRSIVYSLGNFSLPHTSYFNTKLSAYPTKSYKALVYIWNSNGEDEVLTVAISSNGSTVKLIKKQTLSDFQQATPLLNEPLKQPYKQYRSFYYSKRINKKRPVLSRKDWVNTMVFKTYMQSIILFQKTEIVVAKLLDKFGLRNLAKQLLSVIIKRYR